MPVRNIKKSHISVNGFFSSYKNNRQVNFESKLEHDFYLSLEFDSTIITYQEQPFNVFYVYKNRKRRYTPDTLITYKDNSQKVYEVKPKDKLDNDLELQEKIKLQKQQIRIEKGLSLYLFTDADIDYIILDNMKVIYNFAFVKENNKIQKELKEKLKDLSLPLTANEILDILTEDKIERLKYIPYLWNLVFKNPLCIDFKKKITMISIIDLKGLTWEE